MKPLTEAQEKLLAELRASPSRSVEVCGRRVSAAVGLAERGLAEIKDVQHLDTRSLYLVVLR